MSQLNTLEPLDPDDVKDYKVDWGGQLADYDDTIESSLWPIVPAGIVKESDSHNDTSTTIWLSVSTAPAGNYELTNRVVTAGGRTLDQTIIIRVEQR